LTTSLATSKKVSSELQKESRVILAQVGGQGCQKKGEGRGRRWFLLDGGVGVRSGRKFRIAKRAAQLVTGLHLRTAGGDGPRNRKRKINLEQRGKKKKAARKGRPEPAFFLNVFVWAKEKSGREGPGGGVSRGKTGRRGETRSLGFAEEQMSLMTFFKSFLPQKGGERGGCTLGSTQRATGGLETLVGGGENRNSIFRYPARGPGSRTPEKRGPGDCLDLRRCNFLNCA